MFDNGGLSVAIDGVLGKSGGRTGTEKPSVGTCVVGIVLKGG